MTAPSSSSSDFATRSSSSTVHLLDNDDVFRDALANQLRALGFPTIGYSSTAQFMAAEAEIQRGCLVLDLVLGELDGLAVIAWLARRALPLPVVVLTTEADVSGVVRAYQTGIVVRFLQKPLLNSAELSDAIRQAFAIDVVQCSRRRELDERFARLSAIEEAMQIAPTKTKWFTRLAAQVIKRPKPEDLCR